MNMLAKIWRNALPVQKAFAVVAIAALVIMPVAQSKVVFANHDPFEGEILDNVPICHSGDGVNYPPPPPPPSVSSIVGGTGHGAHGFDIIPPFHYLDGDENEQTYLGQNWDSEGQTIWENNCVVPGPTPGNIIIEKQTEPDGDQTLFDFDTNWDDLDNDFSLSDGQTDDSGPLDPGIYSVSEINIPGGWVLSDVTCSDQSDPSLIDLGEGETVTCVFTNTKNGSITIEKVANPSDTEDTFDFEGDVSDTLAHGETATVEVEPGTYTSTELDLEGWTLTGIQCDDDDSTGDVEESTATFNVAAGENVTCTFTNIEDSVPTGTIIVQKVVAEGDNTEQLFDFTASWGNFSLSDGGSENTVQPSGQTYSVSETVPDGWNSPSVQCVSSIQDEETADNIELDTDEVVTCTFTNSEEEGGDGRFTLSVSTSGEGEGTVDGTGIDCQHNTGVVADDCSETYPEGTEVTLTAHPDEDSNFDGSWSGACTGNSLTCVITMTSDQSVNAHFGLNPPQQSGGGGGGGRGGNNDGGQVLGDSDGQVLGEQIAQVPAGAPNTGAGGAAQGGLYGTFLILMGLYGFAHSRKVLA